jgi:hypothetical protein
MIITHAYPYILETYTQLGHNFCKPCILYWLKKKRSCPSCRCVLFETTLGRVLALDRMLEKLDVCCPNHEECTWKGQFKLLQVKRECMFIDLSLTI